jgi:hypothetical protein
MWQSIVLNLIGGLLPTDQRINGVSFVRNTAGNNLIKFWVASCEKAVVEQTRAALMSILDPSDYVTDKVTFVSHKVVLPNKPQQPGLEIQNSAETAADIPKRNASFENTGSRRISRRN